MEKEKQNWHSYGHPLYHDTSSLHVLLVHKMINQNFNNSYFEKKDSQSDQNII